MSETIVPLTKSTMISSNLSCRSSSSWLVGRGVGRREGGGPGFCTEQHLVDNGAELEGVRHRKGKILGLTGSRNPFKHLLCARPQYGLLCKPPIQGAVILFYRWRN